MVIHDGICNNYRSLGAVCLLDKGPGLTVIAVTDSKAFHVASEVAMLLHLQAVYDHSLVIINLNPLSGSKANAPTH